MTPLIARSLPGRQGRRTALGRRGGDVAVEMIYDFETTKSRLIPSGYSTESLFFVSRAVSNSPSRRDSGLLFPRVSHSRDASPVIRAILKAHQRRRTR